MKVHPCSKESSEKKGPKTLTWDQIKEKEGVYKLYNKSSLRFVVLKYNHITYVLLHSDSSLEPASEPLWNRDTFLEVEGAQVCFEIKEL